MLYRGSDPEGTSGTYAKINLNDCTTDGNGFFLIGNAQLPGASIVFENELLRDSDCAAALYRASSFDLVSGTTPTTSDLVDALTFNGDGGDLASGLGLPAPSPWEDRSVALARSPDGGAPMSPASFASQIPTPGTSNAVPDPYGAWAAYFGVSTDPDGNDDFDSLSNPLEFALGTNPAIPDGAGLPAFAPDAFGQPQLSVNKSMAALSAGGTFTVEVSTDLANWSTAETLVTIDDDEQLVVSYTGASPLAFMRLQFESEN